MSGSLSHIIDTDGTFSMSLIENLGDAYEALEECYQLIYTLAGGDTEKVRAACKELDIVDPWLDEYGDDPRLPMRLNSEEEG